ncbi:MAG TPA: hypothetical protein VM577_18625 [Anaerovoracaceae bacterium]|nr:hypothetical protein [Anaerovoracaceae bacterium]
MAGTVRKHHPRGQEKYLAQAREAQAKLEWEQKAKKIEHIKRLLLELTSEERLKVFAGFCAGCGSNNCSGYNECFGRED